MSNPTHHLASLARSVFRRGNRQATRRLITPQREWAIGLLVGLLLLGGMVAWSATVYVAHRSVDDIEQPAPVAQPTEYRAVVVADALQVVADRAQRFADLATTPAVGTPTATPAVATSAVAVAVATTTTATTTATTTVGALDTAASATSTATTTPVDTPNESITAELVN